MNIFIIILIVIAAIIALVLLLALIAKKDYTVARQIVINKPAAAVFEYVKYLKNQDNYSKWVMLDPTMQKTYSGTDGSVGFAYAWDSKDKKAGKGEQVIQAITEGERIDIKIVFIRPFEGIADSYIETQPQGDTTNVKWGFKSRMAYPMNAILLFIDMDKMLGADLDTSLNNLKGTLEKQ
ncbi:SRPBCC family protein [Inquilinus sp. KBS0705]|nr:SRPBCC family protein [Inquilinus sp. KBS0705]